MSAYCDALGRRLEEAAEEDEPAAASALGWLAWARRYVQSLDPLTRLPAMPTALEVKPEELAPYLNGWNPYGPAKRTVVGVSLRRRVALALQAQLRHDPRPPTSCTGPQGSQHPRPQLRPVRSNVSSGSTVR